ncbi:N-acetyltransferase [Xenorhabdus budapestensis]|uniref:GCN5 family acetyltransferase n=1 Tax=Xenorhabdus budapestensis TaxID=290110 RepID=A0A2D0IW73_XENBU|nr:N-acetyltransferase [Xenorhabdus budapestensis]PHM26150.1 GCN5 family acetyltransferase [Xenorhabdus budapestensis]QTL38315.1 N-acetyltransferase [Xenorhabdus budapestensis]
MIRKFTEADMDDVLTIWLEASIKAHHFVAADFWESQVENMRNLYIPASEVYVYVQNGKIIGFYALHDDALAAIFVLPDCQGQGVGSELITDAKNRRTELTLAVYQENERSYNFYLSQGFYVAKEEEDEATGHLEYVMRFHH